MPELPEVETTRRGVAPLVTGLSIEQVWHSGLNMRTPWPENIGQMIGTSVVEVKRRAKLLMLALSDESHVMIHLGMSGVIRVLDHVHPHQKHDHFKLYLSQNRALVLNDPRRFGFVEWERGDWRCNRHIQHLGPEPLSSAFDGLYLHQKAENKRQAIKSMIMDNQVVVGVGNIYASESLFLAGIHPHRAAHRISAQRFEKLAEAIKTVLSQAIAAGGTTLKDFKQSDGKPGYFQQQLMVYGRASEPCHRCQAKIKKTKTGQRATFYCPQCQR